MSRSKLFLILLVAIVGVALLAEAKPKKAPKKLQIGVTYRPDECEQRTKSGDSIKVHYTGTLWENGDKFDSSLDRGDPFEFTLGRGMVIKGWDQGLLNMCVGEKRRLKIPADMAYGERGAPPKIPANAALVFETELLEIN